MHLLPRSLTKATGNQFPNGSLPPDLPALPHPDAELLGLAEDVIAAAKARAERRAAINQQIISGMPDMGYCKSVSDDLGAEFRYAATLARRAGSIPATTPAGLIAKAQIVRASPSGCPKLARSMAMDLLSNASLRRLVFPAEVL